MRRFVLRKQRDQAGNRVCARVSCADPPSVRARPVAPSKSTSVTVVVGGLRTKSVNSGQLQHWSWDDWTVGVL